MTSPDVLLRPVRDADLPALVALNTASVPAVPETDERRMGELVALSSLALAVDDGGKVVGFLLAMDPGQAYDSENYRWFSSRGDAFLYVDRIVLGEGSRGQGLGRRLYERVFDRAAEQGRGEVDCEVNIEPPNPGSLAFHDRMGFRRIGEQATKGGAVRVALLAAPVPGRAPGTPGGPDDLGRA